MENFSTFLAFLGIFSSVLGISWVSRDYLSSFIGGFLIRRIKGIKPGTRIKVLGTPHVIKGDVLRIMTLRTALAEVGDGERLPGIRTGRIYVLPNSVLINNPVLMYGSEIVDQVVAYVEKDPEKAITCMKRAMSKVGVKFKEVDMYQTMNKYAIYGIYESETDNVNTIRCEIMKTFVNLMKEGSSDNELISDLPFLEKTLIA